MRDATHAMGARPPRALRRRRGLTLIEAALVMGVVALVFGGLAQLLSDSSENMKARGAADRLRQVAKASEAYVNAYASEIKTNMGGNALVAIPVSSQNPPFAAGAGAPNDPAARSVQGAGFLPTYFQDKNQYGQSHALIIHKVPAAGNVPEHLEAIVTTIAVANSRPIPDRMLGKIAQFVGGMGGYRLTTPLKAGDVVLGTGGGWNVQPAAWSVGGVSPARGTAQAALQVGDNGVLSDYLNRNDIGIPEANTMHATVTMADKSNGDAYNIKAADGSLVLGPNVRVPQNITSDAGYISAGACNAALVGGDVQACHDVNAGNNVNANNDVNAMGNASANAFVDRGSAVAFNGSTQGYNAANPAQSYWKADPTDLTTLKRINVDELELVSSVPGDRFNPQAGETVLRLRDMLPRYVAKEGYAVSTASPFVAKPTCNGGGDPRIFLTPMQDSWQVKTDDFIKAQSDLRNYLYWNTANGDMTGLRKSAVQTLNCGGGTCSAGYGDYTGGDAIATAPAVTALNMTDMKFYRQYVAQDYGICSTGEPCWQVTLPGTPQVDNVQWKVLAMTYCFH